MKREMNIFCKKAVVVIAVALTLVISGSTVIANFDITGKISANIYDNNLNSKQMYKQVEEQREDDLKDLTKIIDLEEDVGSEIDDIEVPDIFNREYSIYKQPILDTRRHGSSSDMYRFSRLERKTIYVDDDFVDDPPNHKWDTIQEGVDDADDGDTVRVYDGVYYENVIVDKSIDLIGNGSTVTIIDGGNIARVDAVQVVADWMNMSGFGIRNAGDDGIELDSQNNHIMECELYDNIVGIFAYYASFNTIENCTCYNNSYGIYFYESTYGETKNCLCHNNSACGIWFDDSDDSVISYCTANSCNYGIRIESSDDVSLDNCSVSNNDNGTFLYNSENCVLRDNQQFNNLYGFGIYGDYIQDIDNSNTVNGKPIYHVMNQNDLVFNETMNIGYLCVVNCDNIIIQNIELSDVMYGVQIEEASNNCRVTNCEIHDIYHTGIWVGDDSDHRIDNCTIYDVPAYAGIYVREDTTIIEDCEVYNFGHFGIYVSDPYDDVINCSVHDGEMGIRVGDKDILVEDCEVWNNRDSGIFCYSRTGVVLRNNAIWNSTENFGILPSSVSYLLGMDIDTSNTVNGKPIYFLKNQADLVLDETMSIGWIALVSCTNITVENLHFPGFYDGMLLADSDCSIINCSVSGCHYGFLVYDCDYELALENCTAYDNYISTQFQKSEGNNIIGYTAYDNTFGLWIHTSSGSNTLRSCNLYDNIYNFAVRGSNAADFRHDVDTSNLVDGKPIYYILDENNMTFDDSMDIGFLGLVSCEYMVVQDLEINNNDYGVMLVDTTNSEIIGCSFSTHYLGGVYLSYNSNINLVEDCMMYDCGYGIAFYETSDSNTVTGCTVNDSGLGIRGYRYSTNHLIRNCTFYDNSEGVYFYSYSDYNTVINCTSYGSGYGFDIYYRCDYNSIINCQAYDNEFGIDLYSTVDHNRVENCSIYNNSLIGIRCYKCTYGTIMNNVILENYYGIDNYQSSNNDFKDCNLSYNKMYGLYLDGGSSGTVNNNDVTNCSFFNNRYGIYLGGLTGYTISGNEIVFSTFNNNSQYGIYTTLGSGGSVVDNWIHHNNLINNRINAYDTGVNHWDYGIGNYWSDYNGSDINGDGIGDTPYYIPGGDNQDNYPLMNPLYPYLADYDVGVSSIDGLYSGPAGVFTPEVTVTNFGQLPVCCFQVNLQIEKVNATIEYNETLCVAEELYPGENVILTFSDWTPEDFQYGISGSIDYNVTARTLLMVDQIPINDAFIMSITLEYYHDVRVKQITKPVITGFEPQWIHFDDGIYNTAIGLTAGGTYEAAIRITPDELEDLDGYMLSSVKFYHHVTSGTSETHSGNIKIYEAGTASEPGTLITSEPYTVTGEGWFDIYLSESVILDINEDIWVSVEVNHESGEHPIGCDDGPAIDGKGDWISMGGDWSELQDHDLDYNWLIHAFVEYPGELFVELGSHEVEAIVDNIGVYPESNLIVSAKIFKDGNLTYESNFTVTLLDVGEEETILFDDWVVTVSGMYTLEVNIELANDDYPENNIVSIDIGADGEPPVSSHILDPAIPNGDNNWYVSDVTVYLSATDGMEPWQSGVAYIEYKVDGGSVQTGDSVTVTTDGLHMVEYRAVDNVGNEESWNLVEFKIDQTSPEIDLTVEKIGLRKYKFTANVSDAMSGINRVEFYYDGELLGTVTEHPYEWIYSGSKGANATAIVYDNAGNSAEDEKPVSYIKDHPNQLVRAITNIVQQTQKQNIA